MTMKKYLSLFAALAAVVSFNSCDKEQWVLVPKENTDGYQYTFNIVETKATISETGTAWEAGDRVGMFLEGYTGYAEVNKKTTPTSVVLFSPNEIAANTYAYAYFPYDSENSNKTENHIFLANIQLGGSSSSMPLAGIPFKVESDYAAQAKPNGQIKFLNLGSVIDFKVFSSSFNSETVQYITFSASSKKDLNGNVTDLAVTGDGYLDLTGVSESSESSLALTFGKGTDYDYAKVNGLSVAVADSKENATSVYMVVAPGIYTGTITIGTDVATYTFNYSNKTLGRNEIKHYNMDLDNAERVVGVVETVESLPYSEPFTTGIGEFETDGEQVASTDIWQFASGYGMKATAYISSTKYNSESWLTSPWIDLTSVSAAYATFDHVHRYAGTVADQLTLWVLTDEIGSNWEQVTIPNYASGSDWTFVSSGEILLNSYVGQKVKLGFKYTSNTTNAPTWEIKNVHVAEKVYTTEFTMGADAISVEVSKSKNNSVSVNSGATITYSSDDTDIATVDAEGNVTGVAEGSTTINIHVDANGLYPAKDGSFNVTVTPAVSYSSFSWDLSTDETKTASENELSWDYRGVTMVAAKADASTNANNYYPGVGNSSTRFYKSSTLTITPYTGSTIGYVEFSATTEGYATAFANSTWTNATASVDGSTVTVTPEDGTAAFSATIGGTCGFTEVTVYYTGELKTVTKYSITVDGSIANGSVSASAATAEAGDVITLTATPDAGYALSSYDVRDASDNVVTVTDNKFTMPASNVTVSATFTESLGGSVHVATINFNNVTGTAINDASVTGDDSEGNEWTITTAGTTSFTANASYYQVGSSKKPASSITFTTTLASSATDIQLEAKFGGFSGTAGTVNLKVGDTSIGTGSLNESSDVTVSSTSTGSGTVLTVTLTNIAKGVKVYYIKATYTN